MAFRPAKRPDEREYFAFDFAPILTTGESVVSATWTVTVVDGVDPDPNAMVSGNNTIQGSIVSRLIIGGVAGVTYRLHCLAHTNIGQRLEICEDLAVESC
jgi:hypothetical protein